MRSTIVLVYAAIAVLWGSTWAVIRIGLEHLPPLLFAGVRMAIATVVLAPFALRAGGIRGLPREARGRVALVGVFQIALPFGLMFVAQQWVPSSLAAILFATFPIWIALLARVVLPGETLGPAKVLSALVGVAGIVVIQLPNLAAFEASPRLAIGSLLIVAASIVVAFANVLVRRHLVAVSPLAMTTGQTAVGAVALLAAALLFERGRPVAFTPAAWGALTYLAVFGTALTYVGLYWLVPRVPIAAIGALPLLDTTVAVLLGAVLLDEPVGPRFAAGGAMVLAAAWLASRSGPDPART
ncbi:MAG TPA: EamA family transporter [Anaeromyxobacteraceae bacterium]|nr:EamA family transporter [Anaeromyxobacteraceae bacterium]